MLRQTCIFMHASSVFFLRTFRHYDLFDFTTPVTDQWEQEELVVSYPQSPHDVVIWWLGSRRGGAEGAGQEDYSIKLTGPVQSLFRAGRGFHTDENISCSERRHRSPKR